MNYMHRFCIVCFALLGSLTPNAWTWEYRTSWIGNTFGGKDGNFVQMDTRTLFVAPDGTCFLNVPWEEDGNNAGLYRDGQHVSNPGRTHGWGNTGGFAVVANDRYIFIAQSRNSEGGHLHERDPESYPPGGVAWFGLTRRTLASGGKEAAPAPGGKGSGLEIQGLGEDTLAQLAGSFLVINEEPESRDAHIRGLALDNNRGRLYVSNPAKSRIEFYDPETLEKRGEWPIEDTRQMTVGPDGSLWVVVGKIDAWGLPGSAIPGLPSTWAMPTADQLRGFAKIVRFSPDGQLLPQV
ncbi:YncE family protein, partial [Thermaurantiacus sp.]